MSQAKTKVLVCVLGSIERQGWVNPFLTKNLIAMSHSPRHDAEIEMVIDKSPVDYARNYCVTLARERKATWLLMIDNDQATEISPLDVLATAFCKDVIGLPTMQSSVDGFNTSPMFVPNVRRDNLKNDGDFMQVHRIGTGVMFINHRVWERIPGPWFKTVQNENELRTPTPQSEDFYFCDLVRQHGFDIWSHNRMIYHFHTVEIAKLGMHMQALTQQAPPSRPVRFAVTEGA